MFFLNVRTPLFLNVFSPRIETISFYYLLEYLKLLANSADLIRGSVRSILSEKFEVKTVIVIRRL